jgi:hypothetical protein
MGAEIAKGQGTGMGEEMEIEQELRLRGRGRRGFGRARPGLIHLLWRGLNINCELDERMRDLRNTC